MKLGLSSGIVTDILIEVDENGSFHQPSSKLLSILGQRARSWLIIFLYIVHAGPSFNQFVLEV